jgi:hypothetical protein
MVKKKLSYRNKRKSILRKNTKRLKGRKALFRNKTKKLKKRKSQKKKINFQRGGAAIKLNDYIKPEREEDLDKSIEDFIEDFLNRNHGRSASLMKPSDTADHPNTYIEHKGKNRKIVDTSEEGLVAAGSPEANREINRVNLKLFIYSMKNRLDPSPGNYFNGAHIRDDNYHQGGESLTAEVQTGAPASDA